MGQNLIKYLFLSSRSQARLLHATGQDTAGKLNNFDSFHSV